MALFVFISTEKKRKKTNRRSSFCLGRPALLHHALLQYNASCVLVTAVRLLQAPHLLQLRLPRRHNVGCDHPGLHLHQGCRLQNMEQRRRKTLLQLPVVQGRCVGHGRTGDKDWGHLQHRLPLLYHIRLLHCSTSPLAYPQGNVGTTPPCRGGCRPLDYFGSLYIFVI